MLGLLHIDHVDETEHPDVAKAHREATAMARQVDCENASALYPVINSLPYHSEVRNKLGVLAEELDPEMREWMEWQPEFLGTLASSGYLTDAANRIGPAVEAMVGPSREEFSIVSVSSTAWRSSPEQLENLSLVEFVDEIADTFAFLGVNKECGALLGFVHGCYYPLDREFALTLVGIADKPMTEAISKLRGLPSFVGKGGGVDLIDIQPLTSYARPLTTLVQTDWPIRISYLDGNEHELLELDGGVGHPYLAPSLLFRDRWDLSQAMLMIGLYVQDDRLMRFQTDA